MIIFGKQLELQVTILNANILQMTSNIRNNFQTDLFDLLMEMEVMAIKGFSMLPIFSEMESYQMQYV